MEDISFYMVVNGLGRLEGEEKTAIGYLLNSSLVLKI
jgi:hypothetical protein